MTAYMSEHRLMRLYMKHIEDMHIKTNVTLFRCCKDVHGENIAKKILNVLGYLQRIKPVQGIKSLD